MTDNIIDCGQMINVIFPNTQEENKKKSKLINVWEKILKSIKSYNKPELGQNLLEHSNLVEIKNNILLIETDHPGWTQMFEIQSNYILNGLKMYIPEANIKSLAFRLKGSNFTLKDVEKEYENFLHTENLKLNKKIEDDEEKLKKYQKNDENNINNYELPKELLEKFESMKNSVLTKK